MTDLDLIIESILEKRGKREPEEDYSWADYLWTYKINNLELRKWKSCDGTLEYKVYFLGKRFTYQNLDGSLKDTSVEGDILIYHSDSYDNSQTRVLVHIKGNWEKVLEKEYYKIIKSCKENYG